MPCEALERLLRRFWCKRRVLSHLDKQKTVREVLDSFLKYFAVETYDIFIIAWIFEDVHTGLWKTSQKKSKKCIDNIQFGVYNQGIIK